MQPVTRAPRITFFGPVPDVPVARHSEGERAEDHAASDDPGRVAVLRTARSRTTGIPHRITD
eukprot:11641850-Heterocapsa_arctica.AAC.1